MKSPLREDVLFIFLDIHNNISRNSDDLKELSHVAILDNSSSKCKLVRIFFSNECTVMTEICLLLCVCCISQNISAVF